MMTVELNNSSYIDKLRELFSRNHSGMLERCTTDDDAEIPAFFNRSVNYHQTMLPWISEVYPLSGARVLEIGCGDGAATLPIAEVCGHVDAYDIFPEAITCARERAEIFQAENITVETLPPDWALSENIDDFNAGQFSNYDVVLLAAVLEHMLIAERLSTLCRLWELLKPGGILVIYDTPNRLYPFDMHSSRLPFADWLPEDLLLAYASRSPRDIFEPSLTGGANPRESLYRFGRGASYHEFDVAIGLCEMRVLTDGSSKHISHRAMNGALGGALQYTLQAHAPHVHLGFGRDWLELVLQKKWEKVSVQLEGQARRQMLDGKWEALFLEGHQGSLRINTGVQRASLVAEVMVHPWSATLVAQDDAGNEFARVSLFDEVARRRQISLVLPDGVKSCRLIVESNERSLGVEAWLLGIGAV